MDVMVPGRCRGKPKQQLTCVIKERERAGVGVIDFQASHTESIFLIKVFCMMMNYLGTENKKVRRGL